jgi:hypothetical protein
MPTAENRATVPYGGSIWHDAAGFARPQIGYETPRRGDAVARRMCAGGCFGVE